MLRNTHAQVCKQIPAVTLRSATNALITKARVVALEIFIVLSPLFQPRVVFQVYYLLFLSLWFLFGLRFGLRLLLALFTLESGRVKTV